MAIQLTDIQSTEWGLDIDNLGEVVQGLDDIKQCVFIILTTQKRTDTLREDFGCGAYDYVDMPTNVSIPNMKKSIVDCLVKYENRIEKIKIKSEIDVANLNFTISYAIKNTILTDILKVSYGISNT
jgi:phage baseplate assembly protein W